jgi:hypothetical protein
MDAIANKFVQYYLRQVIPYPSSAVHQILKQNNFKQASIITILCEARSRYGTSLSALMKNVVGWENLLRDVAPVVRNMPVKYLQNVGGVKIDFLDEYPLPRRVCELRPGVVFCFRRIHALITDMVRGAWVRYVRQPNLRLLGETADLDEFCLEVSVRASP